MSFSKNICIQLRFKTTTDTIMKIYFPLSLCHLNYIYTQQNVCCLTTQLCFSHQPLILTLSSFLPPWTSNVAPGVVWELDYCLLRGQIWCPISSWKSRTACQTIVLLAEMKGRRANEHLPAGTRTTPDRQRPGEKKQKTNLNWPMVESSWSDREDFDVNVDWEPHRGAAVIF